MPHLTALGSYSARLKQTIWDTALAECGARRRKETTTYVIKTRVHGRQKWVTIGQHGPWTPASARKEAIRLLSEASAGIDPTAERRAKISEPLYAEMVDEFLGDHVEKLGKRTQ